MYKDKIKPMLKRYLYGSWVWILLQAINNTRVYCTWKAKRRKLARRGMLYKFDPDKIHWINPQVIEFRTKGARKMSDYAGAVMGGDWDEWEVRWDDHDQVRWLKEHFIDRIPWEETAYYKSYLHYAKTGEWKAPHSAQGLNLRHLVTSACAGENDDIVDNEYFAPGALDARCKILDELYVSVKLKGVVPQTELLGWNPDPMKRRDNITIGIGRHGDLLFTDGKHRFTIARILGLKSIPVRIWQRHKQWVNFRSEIDLCVKRNSSLYQPMTHVDLQEFRSAHSEDCFDIIQKSLPISSGTMLDLGANWGYFCRRFERVGFYCTAMENDQGSLYYMKKLRRAENLQFAIIEQDILSCNTTLKFNIVLALSIFHHFLISQKTFDKLAEFLQRVEMDYMIFEPNRHGGNIVKNYAIDCGGEDYVRFVIEHSCLNQYRKIGVEPETNRPIYLLSK